MYIQIFNDIFLSMITLLTKEYLMICNYLFSSRRSFIRIFKMQPVNTKLQIGTMKNTSVPCGMRCVAWFRCPVWCCAKLLSFRRFCCNTRSNSYGFLRTISIRIDSKVSRCTQTYSASTTSRSKSVFHLVFALIAPPSSSASIDPLSLSFVPA